MRRKSVQSMKEIIDEFFNENRHLQHGLNNERLIQSWGEVTGPGVSGYTTNLLIRNGTLFVSLSSSVLKNELMMMKEALIRRLNEHVGTTVITNIIFQ